MDIDSRKVLTIEELKGWIKKSLERDRKEVEKEKVETNKTYWDLPNDICRCDNLNCKFRNDCARAVLPRGDGMYSCSSFDCTDKDGPDSYFMEKKYYTKKRP